MPILQSIVQNMPNLLALVNFALDECKQQRVKTVANAKPTINAIVNGINDAIIEIYVRGKWKHREAAQAITMAEGVSDYPVPSDFASIWKDIEIPSGVIFYIDPAGFNSKPVVPGSPTCFTMADPGHLRFSPAPDATFVVKLPQLMLNYYRRPVLVVNDLDVPNLPMEFLDLLKLRGIITWKKQNEFSPMDIQNDQQHWEQLFTTKLTSYLGRAGKRQGLKLAGIPSRTSYRGF